VTDQNPLDWKLRVTMPNGDKYEVPVSAIALNRARSYGDKFGGDVDRSLQEDTLPVFRSSPFEVKDWAANSMDWSDVDAIAVKVVSRLDLSESEFQEGWVNGEKEVIKASG
jgi:hypothetical protein